MKRGGVLAALGLVLTLGIQAVGQGEPPADASPPAGLVESAAGREPCATLGRCRVALAVTGELLAPAGREAAPLRRPIKLDARFDFQERAEPAADVPTVSRDYIDAVATLRIGDDETTTSLAADARRLFFVRHGTMPQPYLAAAFLTGAEYDLLSVPFDAMLLDDLLPDGAVAVGAAWDVPGDLTAGLLAIDTVESGRIEARLQELVAGRARVTLIGAVDGWVDGVPTHIDVAGSFTARGTWSDDAAGGPIAADGAPSERTCRLQPRVEQVSAVIRERRQAGHVGPGFDVEARLTVARVPVTAAATALSNRDVRQAAPARRRAAPGGGPGRVWHRDADGRFDLVHDVRWRLVEDGPSGLVMRLVDHGALVGQCSIAAASTEGVEPPTIADVRRNIERSLEGQVVRIDESTEEERSDGVRVMRTVSSGTAGRLPFIWIHNVLVTPTGNRVDVAFMVQESMRARFAEADRELVAALTVGDGGATDGRPAEPSQETSAPGAVREATDSARASPVTATR